MFRTFCSSCLLPLLIVPEVVSGVLMGETALPLALQLLSFLGDLHRYQREPFLWHTYKTPWDLRVHLTQIFQTSNITLMFAKTQLPGS